jgi:hypothetical protein
MNKTDCSIEELFKRNADDWAHIKLGGKWKAENQFGVVCEYGERLRKAGIPDSEISIIFRDLFWACHRELKANGMLNN